MSTTTKPTHLFDFTHGYLFDKSWPSTRIRPLQIWGGQYIFFVCNEDGDVTSINRWNDTLFKRGQTIKEVMDKLNEDANHDYEYRLFV